MKVAFLSYYSGNIYRGVETFVHELANSLTKIGCEVVVYQNGPELKNAKYKTVTLNLDVDYNKKTSLLSYTPFINYFALKIKTFTQEVLKIIDQDVDVIFPTNGQWESLLCKLWANKNGKKIVISGQSGPGLDDRINLWVRPHVFVGLTDYQQKWAQKAGLGVKTTKIPNGVDLKKFLLKNNSKTVGNKPVFLNAAALVDWKRQDLLIRAMVNVPHSALLLVGQGAMYQKYQDLGQKLLGDRFKITSFPYDQMPRIYPTADVFVFPTVAWESFGIVMVEAMASGLPVVATDDPIRREIVGDAGLFVDPTDTTAFANTLQKALSIKWGNKPRLQAEKFSWDKIAANYLNLFKSL